VDPPARLSRTGTRARQRTPDLSVGSRLFAKKRGVSQVRPRHSVQPRGPATRRSAGQPGRAAGGGRRGGRTMSSACGRRHRIGTNVLKALALGARVVLAGRRCGGGWRAPVRTGREVCCGCSPPNSRTRWCSRAGRGSPTSTRHWSEELRCKACAGSPRELPLSSMHTARGRSRRRQRCGDWRTTFNQHEEMACDVNPLNKNHQSRRVDLVFCPVIDLTVS